MLPTVWQIDPAQITPYYNIALCNALAQQGCRVRYLTSRFLYDPDLPLPDTFETEYLYFRGLEHQWLLHHPRLRKALRAFSYVLGHRELLSQIKQRRPDIIHFQWSRLPRLDRRLIRQIQRLDIPVVHTIHDVIPLYERGSIRDRLADVYTSVDSLIVHTQASFHALKEGFPEVNPNHIHVIPLIAVEKAAAPPGANQSMARMLLALPNHVPVVLFFGSIRHYKGLDVLVEAFKHAIGRCPELHLLVSGSVQDGEQDILVNIKRELLPNLKLHIEYVPVNEMWQHHLAADVAVFPYRQIYQSGALSTAMAYGLPVIVTDVGGLPDLVDGNGWIVAPEDPVALAEAILEAASDRERLRAMGQRSREVLEQTSSSTIVGRMTLALYQEIIAAASLHHKRA